MAKRKHWPWPNERRKARKLAASSEGESVATRMIDAQLNRAMGLPVDDDLIEMLPDQES